jgi:hypothetical protein
MRLWGTTAVLGIGAIVAATNIPAAVAQPVAGDISAAVPDEASESPPSHVGYGALPGGLHVASAEALPEGTVELATLSGYGYRKGLLAPAHRFGRLIGDLAVAYAPVAGLAVGLSLDGRYDKHRKGADAVNDDGYVGDPHLLIRYGRPVASAISLGGQLGVWVPGKDAPSIAASAISVDARALVSIDAGFGVLSANAGFRIDNSAKSVDDVNQLSLEDRVSLGVSDFSAALAGASLRIPAGRRAYVEIEGSADVFVGSGAPGPVIRGGAVVGVALNDVFSVIGYAEVAKVPGINAADVMMKDIALIPYEPAITGGLGLQATFGRTRRAVAVGPVISETAVKVPVVVAETADVSGVVFDEQGKPVVGAKVTIKLKNHVVTPLTDGKGVYSVSKLPIGTTVDGKTELDDTGAEISVDVASKKPGSTTLTLTKGANAVPPITLDPQLPPGQLRVRVINAGTGRAIPDASVAIEPGGTTASSDKDGKLSVDLPPGRYKITVTARGLAVQQLDVNIEQNGVAIKNIELHK